MTFMNTLEKRRRRDFRMISAIAFLLAFLVLRSAPAADMRAIIVTNDLALEKGAVLDARLIIRSSNVTIDGNGAALRGSGNTNNLKSLEDAGTAILFEGCRNVTTLTYSFSAATPSKPECHHLPLLQYCFGSIKGGG
jgi:hypothetical protein